MSFALVLLIASLALQLVAAALAIRLVRVTGTLGAWVLIAAAAALMALRRGMALWAMAVSHREPKVPEEALALVISLLLVAAMAGLGRYLGEARAARDRLASSEAKYRQLVDQLPQPVFETDRSGVLTFANRAALERYGYSGADLENSLDIFGMVVPEDRPRAAERARRVMAGEASPGDVYTAQRKDGTTFVSQVYTSAILENGVPVGLRGISLDISHSKRDEEVLRTHSRQQAVVADLGLRSLASSDLEDLFQMATERVADVLNVECCKLLELVPDGSELLLRAGVGWRPGSVGHVLVSAGRDSQAGFTLASDHPVVVEDFARETRFSAPPILREHGIVSGMSVVLHVGGSPWGVLGAHARTSRAYSDADVHFLQAVANLVSSSIERRHAESALRESEERFRGAFDNAPIGMSLVRSDGTFVQVNQALCRILGRTEGELLRLGLHEISHPDERDQTEFSTECRVGSTSERFHDIRRFVRGDGRTVWAQRNVSPVFDAGGKLLYFVCQLEDVTERRRLEQELLIAQKMEAVGRLAGGVAHDFNNILTVILGHISLMNERLSPDAPEHRDVSEILAAANRAASLTRQLLTFSRHHVVVPLVLDLNEVVTDMESMLRRLIGEDIQFQTRLTPGIGRVKADRGQLEQVLMNFVVNARDAMPNGGTLVVATVGAKEPLDSREWVVLEVSDTGTGIDESVREHLFEPFFTTKAEGKGTGLGLSSAYRIVKESGGDIVVESEFGRGATFRAYLPVTQDPAADAEVVPPTPDAERPWETVLLVEDDDGVRGTTKDILESEGYRVLEARDGESALAVERAHEGPIHALLSDVVLPGITGPQLESALREFRPDIHVLYVSGYTHDALAPRGFVYAGAGFLQKPWTPDALREKLREVLRAALAE